MADNLSRAIQENMLVLLCYDEQCAPIIRNTVDTGHFESTYREVARRIYEFFDTYKEPPRDHIADLFEDKLESDNRRERLHFKHTIFALHENKDSVNAKYTMDNLRSFVRRQSLKTAIMDAAEKLQDDAEGAEQEAEDILNQAMSGRLELFDPGTRLSNFERSLAFLRNPPETFPTGIDHIDKFNGGPFRGGLHLFIGLSGRGKCIAAGERVPMPDGSYKPVENVVGDKDPTTFALNEQTGQYQEQAVANHWDNGRKRCLRLTTQTGRTVLVTPEHPFLTASGWTNVGSVKPGDYVAVPRVTGAFGSEKVQREKVRVLAYLIADGGMTKSSVTFSKLNPDMQRDFERCVNALGDKLTWVNEKDCYVVNGAGREYRRGESFVRQMLKDSGLAFCGSAEKFVPDWVFRLSKPLLSEFLRVLFTCDGSIYNNGKNIEYGTASERLMRDIHHLIGRFGIVSFASVRGERSYRITVRRNEDVCRYLDEIGFEFEKGDRFARPDSTKPSTRVDTVPQDLATQMLDAVLAKCEELSVSAHQLVGQGYYGLVYASEGKQTLTRQRADKIINDAGLDENQVYCWRSVVWDKVVSNEDAGYHHTYDLTMDQHHNFIANDIVVHNTWFTVNLGKRALMRRHKVLHISLEMGEEWISQRYYQALLGMAKHRDQSKNQVKFEFDEMGRVAGMDRHDIKPKFSMDDDNPEEEIKRRMAMFGKRFDNLIIKDFPSGSLTVSGLKAYLDSLEQSENFIPDLLILDYVDIMKIDEKFYRFELDRLYKEVRGIAGERNIAVATVSQSNREGLKQKRVHEGNVAESFAKIAHADTVLTYNQTDQEQALGLARIYGAKVRGDKSGYTVLINQDYNIGQFCRQSALMASNYWDILDVEAPNAEG